LKIESSKPYAREGGRIHNKNYISWDFSKDFLNILKNTYRTFKIWLREGFAFLLLMMVVIVAIVILFVSCLFKKKNKPKDKDKK
jgi:hypothetical protein